MSITSYNFGKNVNKAAILLSTTYTGSAMWTTGTLAPNGSIYYPPGQTKPVLKVNPTTDITSLVGSA